MRFRNDEGATVVIVAFASLLLLGFAALVVDVGMGFNERRHDQTVADTSVMAGALETFGDDADIVTEVKDNATANGIDSAGWAGCADADGVAAGFTPLAGEPCISTSGFFNGEGGTFLRVRVPEQQTDTTFGRLLGVNAIFTDASAIAKIAPEDEFGIRPFGLLAGTGNGNTCLRTGPAGLAVPPCTGSEQGQFFIVDSPFIGNPDIPTTRRCTGQGPARYTGNIKHGLDHLVSIRGTNVLREDVCDQAAPNALETQPGDGFAIDPGLIFDGDALLKGSGPTRVIDVSGGPNSGPHAIDDVPLWNYIASGGAPCANSNFTPAIDEDTKIANMDACMASGVTFSAAIGNSSRLVMVPRFVETVWDRPPIYKSIKEFEPVYINAVYFNCNGTMCDPIFYPGDPDPANDPLSGTNLRVRQLGAYVLDRSMFPDGVLPDEGPGGMLINNQVRLYR